MQNTKYKAFFCCVLFNTKKLGCTRCQVFGTFNYPIFSQIVNAIKSNIWIMKRTSVYFWIALCFGVKTVIDKAINIVKNCSFRIELALNIALKPRSVFINFIQACCKLYKAVKICFCLCCLMMCMKVFVFKIYKI